MRSRSPLYWLLVVPGGRPGRWHDEAPSFLVGDTWRSVEVQAEALHALGPGVPCRLASGRAASRHQAAAVGRRFAEELGVDWSALAVEPRDALEIPAPGGLRRHVLDPTHGRRVGASWSLELIDDPGAGWR